MKGMTKSWKQMEWEWEHWHYYAITLLVCALATLGIAFLLGFIIGS